MSLSAIQDVWESPDLAPVPISQSAEPKISMLGAGGLLFDPSTAVFDLPLQNRLMALRDELWCRRECGIRELVLGVNNLLALFDPTELHPEAARELMLEVWCHAHAERVRGREFEFPVRYGGSAGEDLVHLAESAGLDVDRWIALHSGATYTVACIGSMPGFAYLGGLPTQLVSPRRAQPRLKIPKGSVIIGGAQAGVQPCDAPSGWHLVGWTDIDLFNPALQQPCLLSPGDTIRFVKAS